MKHTHEELTAILSELILDNGAHAVARAACNACYGLASVARKGWKNPVTAEEMFNEWNKMGHAFWDTGVAISGQACSTKE